MSGRLTEHPVVDFSKRRGEMVKIKFQGKEIKAYEGETIGAALFADGITEFSKSFKYKRPRGMFCAIGKCSSCMLRVQGIPNVRTCVEAVKDGMVIEKQKTAPWYSLPFLPIFNRLPFIFKIGFHYRFFTRPRPARAIFQGMLKKLSGGGNFPTPMDPVNLTNPSPIVDIDRDIVVVGGGPSGLAATASAAQTGAKVLLIDENPELGGQLVKQTHRFFGSAKQDAGKRGIKISKEMEGRVKDQGKKVEILLQSTVIGIFGEKKPGRKELGVVQNNRWMKIHAKKVIIATGAYERFLAFENNDLPGVLGAGGVQTMMNVYGIKPGTSALVVGSGNVGVILAYQLIQSGVKVEAVVEALPKIGGYLVHAAKIRRLGVPIFTSHSIKKALGKKRVKGAIIVKLDKNWNNIPGSERKINCDLICLSVGLKPTYELLYQANCDMKFVPNLGGHVPLRDKSGETNKEGIFIAGDASGIEEASTAILEGRIAGIKAAMDLGLEKITTKKIMQESLDELKELRAGPHEERIRLGLKEVLIEP